MQAIILGGGRGERLKPYTNFLPKPLLPLQEDVCILSNQILQLKNSGFDSIIISTGYLHDKVFDEIKSGYKFGVKIQYREDGDNPLGTAGALKNCHDLIHAGEDVLVLNGDILTGLNLDKFIRAHKNRKAESATDNIGSMALTYVDDPTRYGVGVIAQPNYRLAAFVEKPESDYLGNWVNAGIYMLNEELIRGIPKDKYVMLEKDIFPQYIKEGHMYGYPSSAYWMDIGTKESYEKARWDIIQGKVALGT